MREIDIFLKRIVLIGFSFALLMAILIIGLFPYELPNELYLYQYLIYFSIFYVLLFYTKKGNEKLDLFDFSICILSIFFIVILFKISQIKLIFFYSILVFFIYFMLYYLVIKFIVKKINKNDYLLSIIILLQLFFLIVANLYENIFIKK